MQRITYSEDARRSSRSYLVGKRLFDVGTSLFLLIICIPLIILFSLVLLLFSGRPIFFSQTRTGLNNKPFTIWKFRTMKLDIKRKRRINMIGMKVSK